MGLRHPVLNVRYKMTVQLDFGESYSIYAENMTIQLETAAKCTRYKMTVQLDFAESYSIYPTNMTILLETAMEWLRLVGSSKA